MNHGDHDDSAARALSVAEDRITHLEARITELEAALAAEREQREMAERRLEFEALPCGHDKHCWITTGGNAATIQGESGGCAVCELAKARAHIDVSDECKPHWTTFSKWVVTNIQQNPQGRWVTDIAISEIEQLRRELAAARAEASSLMDRLIIANDTNSNLAAELATLRADLEAAQALAKGHQMNTEDALNQRDAAKSEARREALLKAAWVAYDYAADCRDSGQEFCARVIGDRIRGLDATSQEKPANADHASRTYTEAQMKAVISAIMETVSEDPSIVSVDFILSGATERAIQKVVADALATESGQEEGA